MSMHINTNMLSLFCTENKNLRRHSWPAGDYILPDHAEGGTIWYYTAATDELTAGYALGYHDILAGDWEFTS